MKRFQMNHAWMTIATLALSLTLVGCGGDSKDGSASKDTQGGKASPSTLPAGMLVSTAPTGGKAVTELKASSKEGDEVVMHVVIGGREKPIADNRAIMTVVDAATVNACLVEADHCETPWDYCCVAPEDLLKNSATIQLVGADGRPLAIDLSKSKLKPLTTLIVKGKVGPKPDPNALVVNVSAIYIDTPAGKTP